MAQDPESPPAQASEKKKRKWGKLLLLMALVFLVAGGGGLAYIIFLDDPSPPPPGGPSAKPPAAPKALMTLEPFLVNLADKDARRYLKLKVELEVESEKAIKDLEKSLPRLRDALILLLSSKTYPEVATAEGKLQLKEEIIKRLGAVTRGNKISGAYFTEFIAQ